ncbi:MAG: hypothetical protein ACRDNX_11700, partial [Gaiellaceae bacterium]
MHADDRFGHDRFLVKQLIRPMVNLYEVFALSPGTDAPGARVAFVRQKRMALKEDLRAFADDSETEEVFRIKARSLLDVGGRYDVTGGDGTPLGALQKLFGQSLLRSTWRVLDADDSELFVATERSLAVAIGRRIADIVPYGDLLPIPYHFVFRSGEQDLGGLTRVLGLRDQYRLDLSGDPDRRVDRRLAIALAVGLDALQ